MDTSPEHIKDYIKMCDCDEIQRNAPPYNPFSPEFFVQTGTLKELTKKFIWLPHIGQVTPMIDGDWSLNHAKNLSAKFEFVAVVRGEFTSFYGDTQEQAAMKAYMAHHGKTWTGERWV